MNDWNPVYLLLSLLLAGVGGIGVLVQAQRMRDSEGVDIRINTLVGGLGFALVVWGLLALALLTRPLSGAGFHVGPLVFAALAAVAGAGLVFHAVCGAPAGEAGGRPALGVAALALGLFTAALLGATAPAGVAAPGWGVGGLVLLAGLTLFEALLIVYLMRFVGRGALRPTAAQLLAGAGMGLIVLLVFHVALGLPVHAAARADTGPLSAEALALLVAALALLLLGGAGAYGLSDRNTAQANREALVGLMEAHAGLERRAEALAKDRNEELRKARDALRAEKQLAEVTLEAMVEGVVRVNNRGRIRYANAAAGDLTGIEPRVLAGQLIGDVMLIQDERSATRANALGLFEIDGPCCLAMGDLVLIKPGGIRISVEVRISPYHSDESGEGGKVYAIRDTTVERNSRRNLLWQAEHDALTGLKNRRAFEGELKTTLAHADPGAALAFLDLDRFKSVNDQLGHQAGDELLVGIAQALRERLRERDVVARLGGDEFAILLRGCPIDEAVRVMQDMVGAVGRVCEPFSRVDAKLGVSIGVTALKAGMTTEEATRRADEACYDAKSAGRNQVARYRGSAARDAGVA